eukprot:745515-Amphidinium_carterae.1
MHAGLSEDAIPAILEQSRVANAAVRADAESSCQLGAGHATQHATNPLVCVDRTLVRLAEMGCYTAMTYDGCLCLVHEAS